MGPHLLDHVLVLEHKALEVGVFAKHVLHALTIVYGHLY
jgi:hypothetical protein